MTLESSDSTRAIFPNTILKTLAPVVKTSVYGDIYTNILLPKLNHVHTTYS
jgi:hypothetical protein